MTTTMPSPAPTTEPGELARPHWATRSSHDEYSGSVLHLYVADTRPAAIDPCTGQPGEPFPVELSQRDHLEYDADGSFSRIRREPVTVWIAEFVYTPDEARLLHKAIGEALAALDGGDW